MDWDLRLFLILLLLFPVVGGVTLALSAQKSFWVPHFFILLIWVGIGKGRIMYQEFHDEN